MTIAEVKAVGILNEALTELDRDPDRGSNLYYLAWAMLSHAITHISKPDRSRYPKTRKGTKRNPVTR